MRLSIVLLTASVAALVAATAVAQDIDSVFEEDLLATESPAALPAPIADPYPLDDATGLPPVQPLEQPVEPGTGSLRPSIAEIAPLRTVVRPVLRSSVPTLPLTGSIPAPFDPEAEAQAAYAPLGLKLGGFDVSSTSRSAIGSSSTAGTFYSTAVDIAARSDWERHSLGISLRGGMVDYLDNGRETEPTAALTVDGGLDLTEVDRLAASLGYAWSREDADSPELGGGAAASNVQVISGSLGYERTAGLIGVALRGAVDHSDYSRSADRTNTAYSISLRTTLDNGAMVEPFVEAAAFGRRYQNAVDGAGYRRDSIGGELKGGITVDTGLLRGDIAIGYALEDLEDERLANVEGFIGEASLAWAPTRLTTVTVTAATSFEPTQLVGSSGSIDRTVGLSVAHALRPNISLEAGVSHRVQDYTGIDRQVSTTTVRTGGGWRINRSVEIGLAASHEVTDTSGAGGSNDETRVEATVTMRR